MASIKTIAGALPLAVDRVNEDASLLPGRKLDFRWRDSGCSASAALQGLGSLQSGGDHPIDAVIGPGCSVACEPTGYLTAGVRLLADLSLIRRIEYARLA